MQPDESSGSPDERIQATKPSGPNSGDESQKTFPNIARRGEPWITIAIGAGVFGVLVAINFWPYQLTEPVYNRETGCGLPFTHATSTRFSYRGSVIGATVSGGPVRSQEETDRLIAADRRLMELEMAWHIDQTKVALNLGVALLIALAAMLLWSSRLRSAQSAVE